MFAKIDDVKNNYNRVFQKKELLTHDTVKGDSFQAE